MTDKQSLIISLRGGLGNQLFQFAASLYLAKECEVKIEWNVGRPNLNSKNQPEITSFTLPRIVKFMKKKRFSWLMSKSNGYLFRVRSSPRWYENNSVSKKIITCLADCISYIYFKRKITTCVLGELGYSEIKLSTKKTYLNGYFQSYKWASDPLVFKQMKQLKLSQDSEKVEHFKKLALVEKPLVVHIRLGDYKFEKNFGTLHPDYYCELVEKFWALGDFNKIWVFSDEIDLAKNYFQGRPHLNFRYFPNTDMSPSSTLEVMRHGYGYIIGNSTFSWWAAFLTYSPGAKVIAPFPWFRNMSSPKEIIPPHWDIQNSSWLELDEF